MKIYSLGAGSAAVFMLIVSMSAGAAPVSGQGTWETTLQARDLDSNPATIEAYYDTTLNITWLANASYAGSFMDWATANAWATGLSINGVTGWRLPTVSPIDGTTTDDANVSYIGTEDRGYNISAPGTLYAGSTASEMAHLFYNTLGNKGYCDPSTSTVGCSGPQAGWGLTNSGPFSNLTIPLPYGYLGYWSATEYAPDTNLAWGFDLNYGPQDAVNKTLGLDAWAVHAGDVGVAVASVPVPAAVWLFGSGLLGLIGMGHRKIA